MSDEFNFDCPKCGQELEAEKSMIGQCFDCPACGQPVEVPDLRQAVSTSACTGQIQVPRAASSSPMTPGTVTTRPTTPQQAPAETIFCPKCGEKNRENNFKCTRCGCVLHGSPEGQRVVAASNTTYEIMADKVGLVPNIRKKDNIFQAIFTLAFAIVGTIIGLVCQGGLGAGIGALAGVVAGGLISGVILCVVGLARK